MASFLQAIPYHPAYRRGYGRSPATTKPYRLMTRIPPWARKVTHAALVASSHGGEVALNFTLRYTANVSHLVLIGPAATGFRVSHVPWSSN